MNASTQNGNSLWQVHSVNRAGLVAPRFYEIDTSDCSIIQTSFIVVSETAYSFNASIVANANNDVFVTYSSTDPTADVKPQVRYTARMSTDTESIIKPGFVAFAATAPYEDGFRWGDYSAITVDPVDSTQAWFVNEKVNDSFTWGSGIGTIRL